MRTCKVLAMLLILLLCASLATAKTTSKRSHRRAVTRSHHSRTVTGHKARPASRRGKAVRKGVRSHGQKGIDSPRARQIQTALIREHYLDGEPTGAWDQRTRDAMIRFQSDNGWQTKVLPDSRALIKLGLGPSHEGALNPERTSINHPSSGGDSDQDAPPLPR